MSSAQKIIQAAAGNAAGEGLYVEEVFSTYLYTGTDSSQTITNGIDLDGEGGLTWIKARNFGSSNHALFDTERGGGKYLQSNESLGEETPLSAPLTFNSDGFTINTQADSWNGTYYSNTYASWTFRKAPKFFDVVTYTGNGTTGREISHNLESVPGTIIVKKTSGTSIWPVWHREMTVEADLYKKTLRLNETRALDDNFGSDWGSSNNVTSQHFQVGTEGGSTNTSNETYVAYLFAHNDGDGEFGEDADQDIIKCGSYTGNGLDDGPEIDLGFEPQWLLVKNASDDGGADPSNWWLVDSMRGWTVDSDVTYVKADTSDAELTRDRIKLTQNGFKITTTSNPWNGSGDTFIYIAIRRGPMKTPEDATEVFAVDTANSTSSAPPVWSSGFPVDMAFYNVVSGGDKTVLSRMTGGQYMAFNKTNAEAFDNNGWDFMDGWYDDTFTNSNFYSWMFRRAPGFFDVVAYEGDGSADNVIKHNLAAIPELVIIKRRDSTTGWYVGTDFGESSFKRFQLQKADSAATQSYPHGIYKKPTATAISVGVNTFTNASGSPHIAYLFATLPGVSKVGSYTGNGTSQTIDCGFSTGARFVLIKGSSNVGDWHVYDSERGIVAGNDPRLELNTTDAEDTGSDDIDPVSSGFSVTSNTDVNTSGRTYIFLAIA